MTASTPPSLGATASLDWGSLPVDKIRRVGVVDVGSNSIRLVVFDGVARSPAYFFNEKVLCGLGDGINETGRLNVEGKHRAMAALQRFAELAQLMEITALRGVATAAVRMAEDGPEFCAEVLAKTGLNLVVATGRQEAELSAKGVLLGWPGATGIVCDIGGASMELARLDGGVLQTCETSPLGPLQLTNLKDLDAVDQTIDREISILRNAFPGSVHNLFLVGGSWRAIARLNMSRNHYPLNVLHEYRIAPEQFLETTAWIAESNRKELAAVNNTSAQRLRLLPLASRIISRLVSVLDPDQIVVSSYGIREGMLYNAMPTNLLNRDPLLEAARHSEKASARFPGFGAHLFRWVQPIFDGASPSELRLVEAACYLHDISWRTHPDYRSQVCFDVVTRSNLGGVDHAGRVFLGLAIMHRYKTDTKAHQASLALLTDHQRHQAAILGRAIRLGAMLSGAVSSGLTATSLQLTESELRLLLHGTAADLDGEVVQKRLRSLAQLLKVQEVILTS